MKSAYISMVFLVVLALGVGISNTPTTTWEEPELIWASSAPCYDPISIIDPVGDINVFWQTRNYESEPYSSVMFTKLKVDERVNVSAEPIDIFTITQKGTLGGGRSLLDGYGRLNYFVSTRGYSSAFHSWALNDNPFGARDWAPFTPITHDAAFDLDVTKVDGKIYMVYAITGANNYSQKGVFFSEKDTNNNWTWPVNIAYVTQSDLNISDTRLAVDGEGCIHVIYTEVPDTGYPPLGSYYSRSCDQGETWSEAILLQSRNQGNPRIAAYGNEIHVITTGAVGNRGRFHIWSSDGGRSWSNTEILLPEIEGLSGGGIVVDSNGVFHMALVDKDGSGIIYSSWENGTWSAFRTILKITDVQNHYVEAPTLSINEGDKLLVSVCEYSRIGMNQGLDESKLWIIRGDTDSPEIIEHYFKQIQQSTPTPEVKITPTKTLPIFYDNEEQGKILNNSSWIAIIAAFTTPTILIVIVIRRRKKMK